MTPSPAPAAPASSPRGDQDVRTQIERAMGDPMRCMPGERRALEKKGFVADDTSLDCGCGLNGLGGRGMRRERQC